MSDFMYCIVFYLISTILFTAWHITLYRGHKKRNNLRIGHFIAFLITFWTAHIFNFAYTWYFGWNRSPINSIEHHLDNITLAAIFTSAIMLWCSFKSRRELIEDAKNKRIS